MYRPTEIADFFLSHYGQSESHDITPMKIIKLVYIAHGWYLGYKGEALIDENPEAWKYGPVIPSLYHEYKDFKDKPIRRSYHNQVELKSNSDNNSQNDDSKFVTELLVKIWEVYGSKNALVLSAMTHKKGTPWHKTWQKIQSKNLYSFQIPETEIREYYKNLIGNN